ncbi:MAG: LptF/LptG family permease [Planctomycetes bacterium]|nr:LptF/LptG family permease [Planctomycetota bacterium]
MTRYDRYFLWVFTQSLIAVVALLSTVFVVVDVLLNTDEFRNFDDISRGVTLYYSFNLPPILYLGWPLIIVAAGMFTLIRMLRSRELLVLEAAGVSPRRALMPLILPALLLGVIGLALREAALPALAQAQRQSPYGAFEFRKGKRISVRDNQGNHWFVRKYDLNTGFIEGVRILSKDGNLLVVAPDMAWAESANHWRTEKQAQVYNLAALTGDVTDAQATTFAGAPPFGDLLPGDFARRGKTFADQSVSELWRGAGERPDYLDLRTAASHELWHPFGGLALLLCGCALALWGRTRGFFTASLLTLACVSFYFIGVFWFEALARAGMLPPEIAAALTPSLLLIAGTAGLWKN